MYQHLAVTQPPSSCCAGITMQELCTRFMSDESSFYVDFHHARGDEQCSISRWRTHHPLGRVRELQFITTLKVDCFIRSNMHTHGANMKTNWEWMLFMPTSLPAIWKPAVVCCST